MYKVLVNDALVNTAGVDHHSHLKECLAAHTRYGFVVGSWPSEAAAVKAIEEFIKEKPKARFEIVKSVCTVVAVIEGRRVYDNAE